MKPKRFVAFLLTAIICLPPILSVPLSAAAPTSLLVLGDSISTGYGLTADENGKLQSYGNQLAEALGLSGKQYQNLAVNGAKSGDLLALLPTIEDKIKAADTIVISIGGNDVLGKMLTLLSSLSAKTDLASAIQALLQADVSVLSASFGGEAVTAEFNAAINQYAINLAEIVKTLEAANPNAQVIFLTQYNPLNGATAFAPKTVQITQDTSITVGGAFDVLFQFSETVITGLNEMMHKVTEGSSVCALVDVYTDFAGRGGELTRIYQADIHPNQAGHNRIYELLAETLGITETAAVLETTADVETTAAAPESTQAADPVTTFLESTQALDSITTSPDTGESVSEPAPIENNLSVAILICLGVAILCMAAGILLALRSRKAKK